MAKRKSRYQGYRGIGLQNLGRGVLMQGLGPGGKPTQAYQQAHPTPQPQPIDPVFEQQKANANLGTNLALGEGVYQHQNTAYDTGYNADGTVNTANPYSQAALLQETYNRSKLGTTNSYASSGQLHSGAYGRMQNENFRNYSIGSNELQVGAARAHHGIDSSTAQAGINYGVGNTNEGLNALLRALGVQV